MNAIEVTRSSIEAASTSPIALQRHFAEPPQPESDSARIERFLRESIFDPAAFESHEVHVRIPWKDKAGRVQRDQWAALTPQEQQNWLWEHEKEQVSHLYAAWLDWNARVIPHYRLDDENGPFKRLQEFSFVDDMNLRNSCTVDFVAEHNEGYSCDIVNIHVAREGHASAWRNAMQSSRWSVGRDILDYHTLNTFSCATDTHNHPDHIRLHHLVFCRDSRVAYGYEVGDAARLASDAWLVARNKIKAYRDDPSGFIYERSATGFCPL